MTENLYEALEVCLRALETGADIGSVLKLYPHLEADLRPILETMKHAQSLSAPEVPQTALRRGRARVLQVAAEMRASTRKPRRTHFTFTRFATALALTLVFLLGGTGIVNASSGALPGDHLYPVKRSWETVRLWFAFSPEGREELESEYEQERLNEVDELLNENREEVIAFYGILTARDGDYWLVSGVPVQLTANTQLPANPVAVGVPVTVIGRTNAQGFIEAQMIGVLESGVSLPPLRPTELELEDETGEGVHDEGEEAESSYQGEEQSQFYPFEFSGVITSRQGTIWWINNQEVDVSQAEIVGTLLVGDLVTLEGYYAPDGTYVVTKIQLKVLEPQITNSTGNDQNTDESYSDSSEDGKGDSTSEREDDHEDNNKDGGEDSKDGEKEEED